MAEAPPDRRARALPFLAFFLLVVGSCEVYQGVNELGTRGYLPTTTDEASASPEAAEHFREASRLLEDDPRRGPIAGATVLVGAMLAIGGFLFMRRSANAVWWAKQAAGANILVAAIELVSAYVHYDAIGGQLHREFQAAAEASADVRGASEYLDAVWITKGALTGMMLAVFLYILWRVTRPDVRAALDEAS